MCQSYSKPKVGHFLRHSVYVNAVLQQVVVNLSGLTIFSHNLTPSFLWPAL